MQNMKDRIPVEQQKEVLRCIADAPLEYPDKCVTCPQDKKGFCVFILMGICTYSKKDKNLWSQ